MFLDKILRWTNSSQFIDEYSRILFDEFVHTNNAQVAFNIAMSFNACSAGVMLVCGIII